MKTRTTIINGKEVKEGDTLKCYHFTDEYGTVHRLTHSVAWSDKYHAFMALHQDHDDPDKIQPGTNFLYIYMKSNHEIEIIPEQVTEVTQ